MKTAYVIRIMDHATFVCLATMVMHAIFHVHVVLRDHVIKYMASVPLDVMQACSWTDVMQLVLKAVTKHVISKVGHVLVDASMGILETIVKLPVQYIVQLTAIR